MCNNDERGMGMFFFFKQKTAYEMRISDWSSDVCSSDLLGTRMGRGRFRRLVPRDTHLPEQRVLALPAVEMRAQVTWGKLTYGEPPLRPLRLLDPPQPIEVTAEVTDGPPRRFTWRRSTHILVRYDAPKLGRASAREKYVSKCCSRC